MDIVLTAIAKLTLADRERTHPEYMTVVKSLRKKGGEPINLAYLQHILEQCVLDGWLDEAELKVLNRMKLTEKVWAMWKG